MSARVMFLLGGLRIGDTISATAGFRQLCKKYSDTFWLHGAYASQCFDLFEATDLPMLGHAMVPETVVPEDIHSVDLWRGLVNMSDWFGYDLYQDFETGLFLRAGEGVAVWQQLACGMGVEVSGLEPPHLYLNEDVVQGEYVCVQGSTISEWKAVPSLGEIEFPAEAYELGWEHESEGLPNTTSRRGLPLLESAKLLAGCRMFVGICSSMAVLAAALGKPVLQLHFDADHILSNGVSQWYEHGYDLIQPAADQLQVAVGELWREAQDA